MSDRSAALQRAVGLEDVDRDLIRLLQADGRRSYAELARELGIPQRQVRRRLTELCESGVVYIMPVGDPRVLGYRTLAIVAMRARGRPLVEIAADLADLDEVDYVNLTAGRFDLFAQVLCRDLGELLDVTEGAVRVLPGIEEVEVFPYLRVHYQEAAFRVPDRLAPLTHAAGALAIDDLDRAIVAELSKDGRMPLNQVADSAGTSETQVRRRLKRLEDSGAVRVMAITNPLSHGLETIARLAITVSPGHTFTAVADALAELETISYVAVCTGRYDLFCEALCVDVEELGAVVDERVRSIKGVERCETFLHLAPLHYKPLRPPMLRGSRAPRRPTARPRRGTVINGRV
jgi:DNA-binding Lrp family transcriptional regulator